jgi:DNA-directed RNA polymerase specialized sigma24 family protein
LEGLLKAVERYQREVVMDPGTLAHVADISSRTWADLLPDSAWQWERLARGLHVLPPRLLHPFLLHFHEGRPLAEVARELGLHRVTVYRRLQKALVLLKTEMRGKDGPGDEEQGIEGPVQ